MRLSALSLAACPFSNQGCLRSDRAANITWHKSVVLKAEYEDRSMTEGPATITYRDILCTAPPYGYINWGNSRRWSKFTNRNYSNYLCHIKCRGIKQSQAKVSKTACGRKKKNRQSILPTENNAEKMISTLDTISGKFGPLSIPIQYILCISLLTFKGQLCPAPPQRKFKQET